MTARSKLWADWSWRDFEAADMRRVIAVLPVGAIEQHGPHLPVGVDAWINQGYLDRAVAATPDDIPALYLPLQQIGKSNEHIEFPGTLTYSTETVIRAWIEIGESVARTGCRKIVFMNSHGGNSAVLDIVTRELRARHAMLAIPSAWHRLGYPDGLFSPRERAHGIHGGGAETSLMLAFRPQAVKMAEARDFESAAEGMERDFAMLRVIPPHGFGWLSSDLNPNGVVGEADKATAEKGEASADFGVARFIELLRDVDAFDLARLAPGPLKAREP